MESFKLSRRERACIIVSFLLLLGWNSHVLSIYLSCHAPAKDYNAGILMAVQQYNSDNSAHNQMKFDVRFLPEHIAWLKKRKEQLERELTELEETEHIPREMGRDRARVPIGSN